MIGAATRQVLASQMAEQSIGEIIATYRAAVSAALAAAREAKGGAATIADVLEAAASIVGVFELVDLAQASAQPLADVAAACARLNANLDLVWLDTAIARLPASNRWQARARTQLGGELRTLRQALLHDGLIDMPPGSTDARSAVEELKRNAPQDLAMLSAGLSEIKRLLTVVR